MPKVTLLRDWTNHKSGETIDVSPDVAGALVVNGYARNADTPAQPQPPTATPTPEPVVDTKPAPTPEPVVDANPKPAPTPPAQTKPAAPAPVVDTQPAPEPAAKPIQPPATPAEPSEPSDAPEPPAADTGDVRADDAFVTLKSGARIPKAQLSRRMRRRLTARGEL
ncbi:hypothetical protein V7x_28770 [Crateriforma conspicua]|uniref:Uncharacterized protein n=1 Tax=Crateriforma conspicua TaxID=2527996 RepID=A0A5C6G283_9PLAN|nr:hypothetical protein [Crateriforma conspicua]TWU67303.1 hypothetical protein V7x_28770 [Crateriforma conspicua]